MYYFQNYVGEYLWVAGQEFSFAIDVSVEDF